MLPGRPAAASHEQERPRRLKRPRIGIVGGTGWLGKAVGRGILAAGVVEAGDLVVSSRNAPGDLYADQPAVRWTENNAELARACDVVVLSVRPQQFAPMRLDLANKLVVSVMAAVSCRMLAERTGADRIVRAMPNAGVELGKSYTPWFAGEAVTHDDKALVAAIFAAVGRADEVFREADIDYLTGLSGAGPAFPALLASALLGDATARGLPRHVAERAVENVVREVTPLIDPSDPDGLVSTCVDYDGTTAAARRAGIDAGFVEAVRSGLAAAAASPSSTRAASAQSP